MKIVNSGRLAVHEAKTTGIHGAGSDHLGLSQASQLVSKVIWLDETATALQDLNRTSEQVWTDLDLTAHTSVNTKLAIIKLALHVDTKGGAGIITFGIRKNGTTPTHYPLISLNSDVAIEGAYYFAYCFVGLDDGEVMEYIISLTNWTGWQLDSYVIVLGYIE